MTLLLGGDIVFPESICAYLVDAISQFCSWLV